MVDANYELGRRVAGKQCGWLQVVVYTELHSTELRLRKFSGSFPLSALYPSGVSPHATPSGGPNDHPGVPSRGAHARLTTHTSALHF